MIILCFYYCAGIQCNRDVSDKQPKKPLLVNSETQTECGLEEFIPVRCSTPTKGMECTEDPLEDSSFADTDCTEKDPDYDPFEDSTLDVTHSSPQKYV